ncbi:MAG: tetratricopeptide repeat protein [Alphaproteobacteria bacterium]|tara:strand:- start:707 stop:1354 length:648 start_codon:yes stop_codon:yes gene_type:complete
MLIIYFIIVAFVILIISSFLFNPLKIKKNFLLTLVFLSITSLITYRFIGNIESFFYNEKIEKEIKNIVKNPNDLVNIDPKKIIFFLETKLKSDPNDLVGWKVLTKTCYITGHYQKADLHFKNSLKYFPENEDLLLQYSILKRDTNQFSSAINLLEKVNEINPYNRESIKLYLSLLIQTLDEEKIIKKVRELQKDKQIDSLWLKKLLKDLKLEKIS